MLVYRNVDNRCGFNGNLVVTNVSDHSGYPDRIGTETDEPLAQRILISHVSLNECPVDNDNRFRFGGVSVIEIPALKQLYPHRIEVSVCHVGDIGQPWGSSLRIVILEVESGSRPVSSQGNIVDEPC